MSPSARAIAQSPSEEDELDLMKNEMNGQTTDDDQDEEVEVVNEESPTSEDLELMVEEPRYVEPANAWLNVDINDLDQNDEEKLLFISHPGNHSCGLGVSRTN